MISETRATNRVKGNLSLPLPTPTESPPAPRVETQFSETLVIIE